MSDICDRWRLPARVIGEDREDREPRLSRVVIVTDPDLGDVPVRWRTNIHPGAWVWRCTPCETTSTTADCRHTFAAALALAQTLLGLTAVGVAPPPERTTP